MPQQIPIFNQHSSSVKIHPHDSDEKQTGRQLSEPLMIRIELPGTEHIGYCGAKKNHFSRHIVTSHSLKRTLSMDEKSCYLSQIKKSLIPFRKFKLWYKPCRINFDVRSIAYT